MRLPQLRSFMMMIEVIHLFLSFFFFFGGADCV